MARRQISRVLRVPAVEVTSGVPSTGSVTKSTRKRSAPDDSQQPSKRITSHAVNNAAHTTLNRSSATATKRSPKSRFALNVSPSTKLEIFVFGEGSSGELGLGPSSTSTEVRAPRINPLLHSETVGVVSVACGGMHNVALTHDNRVYTWGINDESTLARDTRWDGAIRGIGVGGSSAESDSDSGLNPLESTPAPIPADSFPADTKFVQVAAGDSSTFILTQDGLVYGWGTFRDDNGIYGFTLDSHNHITKVQIRPMLIPGLSDITSLSVGNDFVLALDARGTVFAWGTGPQAQLGRRLVERRRSIALLPAVVGFPKKNVKIKSIHAACNHAFAIDTNGDTWAWGLNNFAQTGIADGAGKSGSVIPTPRRVLSLGNKMRMVVGGSHHSIGITHNGECLVWGRIDGGQMGLEIAKLPVDDPKKVIVERGKARILLEPISIPIPNCVYAAAGPDHNIVITSEGKAYSWGFNATFQCGQGTDDDIPVAKLMNGKAIREKKIIWAGAGGQYSMLASAFEDPKSLTNGASAG
ncbi:MAG: hypothetical protein M1839_009299 [Geoglossum umbratile]|nr:MAG: hypothetical protein M1839_009299 [Geoglossum umbratile]